MVVHVVETDVLSTTVSVACMEIGDVICVDDSRILKMDLLWTTVVASWWAVQTLLKNDPEPAQHHGVQSKSGVTEERGDLRISQQ